MILTILSIIVVVISIYLCHYFIDRYANQKKRLELESDKSSKATVTVTKTPSEELEDWVKTLPNDDIAEDELDKETVVTPNKSTPLSEIVKSGKIGYDDNMIE